MHPLASISKTVLVNATYHDGVTTSTDAKGNPVISFTKLKLLVMVSTMKDQIYLRSLYAVDNSRKIVRLYIQKAWQLNEIDQTETKINVKDIEINLLGNLLTTTGNKLTFTIVDRNQSNITLITDIFGKVMVALQDGFL